MTGQPQTTAHDGTIRISEPQAMVEVSSPMAIVDVSAPMAHVKVSGPACIVEMTGMNSDSPANFAIPVHSIPDGWVVQAIRHRWWVRSKAPDETWVCEMVKLESEDGRIVTGVGPTPLAAAKNAIGIIDGSQVRRDRQEEGARV